MFGAEKGSADKLDGRKLSIGIVQARFNESITNALAEACKQELATLGVEEKNIRHVKVHWKCLLHCRHWQKATSTMR